MVGKIDFLAADAPVKKHLFDGRIEIVPYQKVQEGEAVGSGRRDKLLFAAFGKAGFGVLDGSSHQGMSTAWLDRWVDVTSKSMSSFWFIRPSLILL